MKVRFNDRIIARELRSKGWTFSEIRAKIPNLSKGTLNGWLKDIELTPEQKTESLRKSKMVLTEVEKGLDYWEPGRITKNESD